MKKAMKTALERELELLRYIAEESPTIAAARERFELSYVGFFRQLKDLRNRGAEIVADKKTGRVSCRNWGAISALVLSWLELEQRRDFRMGFSGKIAGLER